MNSQVGARMVYDNAKAALMKGGLTASDIENAVLSQSFLRFEQPLVIGQTQFVFPILNNQTSSGQSIRATEKRLNLQDAMYVSEIAVYIAKASSATDASFVLKTYPSPVTFATGAASLGTFYNGQLQIAVNNRTIVTGMDLTRFLQAPQTQLTAATNSPIDEFDGANDRSAFYALEPNVVLNGQKNSQVVINLPASMATLDASTYAVIVVRGVLAQNVTVVS
jgi:hypothetical protein